MMDEIKYRLVCYCKKGVFYVPVRTVEEAGVIADTLLCYNNFLDKKQTEFTSELEIYDEDKMDYVEFDTEKWNSPTWYNLNLNANKDELIEMSEAIVEMNNLFRTEDKSGEIKE